jgi:outer membrane protein
MRYAPVFVVVTAVGGAPLVARADLLTRAVAAAAGDDAGGGAPVQPADLTAWAGPARATNLPELLQTAVRQAPALQTARIDIAIAEAQIQQTWARNDWALSAQLATARLREFTGRVGWTTTASADITHTLPTGGTIDLHAAATYGDAFVGLAIDKVWGTEVTASFTQPLLRGRGPLVFDANERRALLSRDVAVLARRLAAIQSVQNVVSTYWDLVLAERQVAITQSSLDLAKERLRITQVGADGGKIPKAELPAVQQIIATREEDVLNGELVVLDRSITVRRAAGLPIGGGELGLRVAPDLETRELALDLGQLVERAYAASPELAELQKQGDSATIEIAVTENGLLPQLDAALSIGPSAQDPSFATAWKNTATLKDVTVSGTLTYQQSLHRDDVRGRARELRETKRKLVVNAFDLRAQIAQTMSRAVAQLEVAKRRILLSQRAIELANENIKVETDRFNLGKSTNFDILNRQEELRQAEIRKAQAMIDFHKAETVVQALTGDILPAYGITVE